MEAYRQTLSAYNDGRTRRLVYRIEQLDALHRLLTNPLSNEKLNVLDDATKVARLAGLVADIAADLLLQIKQGRNQELHKVPATSSLIIGSPHDPLGSLIAPLAIAIAAGSCVVLRPDEINPRLASDIEIVLPKYLDYEAFMVSRLPLSSLLQAPFQRILVPDGVTLPEHLPLKVSLSVVNWPTNPRILCHLDPADSSSSTIQDQLVPMLLHANRQDSLPEPFHAVIVLESEADQLVDDLLARLNGSVRRANIDDLYIPIGSISLQLLIIGVTSTEEALIHLTQRKYRQISSFTYIGNEEYGLYMLKFLPNVIVGAINVFPTQAYPSLSVDTFQTRRYVVTAKKAKLLLNTEASKPKAFPLIPRRYGKNKNFFLQGHDLSVFLVRVVTVVTFSFAGRQLYHFLSK